MAHADTTRPGGDNDHGGTANDDAAFEGDTSPFAEEDARAHAQDVELELGDEDVRLPWLEGADDDEVDSGYNPAQIFAYLAMGVIALALIVGGVYWLTRSVSDPELVAQGDVIEAPAEPYKEKPEDPGGKTFEGTGDSSFVVSEGDTRPGRLGASETPKPGFATVPGAASSEPGAEPKVATASPSAPEPDASAAAQPAGVGVQIGAYTSRATAEAGWSKLVQQYDVLNGMNHRIVEGRAEIGTVFRLQAVPGDVAAAKSLCSKLQSSGLNCYVKR